MVDLKVKPFYLDEESCEWVEQTLARITRKERVGQLFCEILWDRPDSRSEDLFEHIQSGGVMYRPPSGKRMHEVLEKPQSMARIPLLVACNLEQGGSGGNGSLMGGVYVTSSMGAMATGNAKNAYLLGRVVTEEGAAVGINWTLEPIIDIDRNRENSITNVRTHGSDVDRIIACAKRYMDAYRESETVVTVRHFPGDGAGYRDQYPMASINSPPAKEWYKSYGCVYRTLIDYDTQAVMSAYIRQPYVTRDVNPDTRDEEIIPGSLSRESNERVLREKLGPNGVIVTDATQMVGFTSSMPRALAVPTATASGADVFLFTINQREDVGYMMTGVEAGIINEARLDEAVTYILALKASLNLYRRTVVPPVEQLGVIDCRQHVVWAREICDRSVISVKDKENLLPLSPQRTKRVKLIQITDERIPEGEYPPEIMWFKELLEQEGFSVTYFKDEKHPGCGYSLEEFKEETDLIVYFANMKVGSNQATICIVWGDFLGGGPPKYVDDILALFVSFSNPHHLVDVPMVKTYINACACNNYEVEAVVEKLMGRSEFRRISPADTLAEFRDTRL